MTLSGCLTPIVKAPNEEEPALLNKIKTTTLSAKKENTDITEDSVSSALEKAPFYPDIWDEMRLHFNLANQHYGEYEEFISFYRKRQTHMRKISERAEPYLYYIFNEVKSRGMPYEIALLPAVESGFRAQAESHQKALGLWQFIPSTGDVFDLHRNWWYDGRKDVVKSTQAALDYLEKLYKLNDNDWLLALASYNSGLGNVYKAQKKYRKLHKHEHPDNLAQPSFWQIKPYLPKETQGYVPKLLALAHIYEYKELFEVELTPIANEPFFTEVQIDKQIALDKVLKLSKTEPELFFKLNPAFKRIATPPKGPYNLLLPQQEADLFTSNLQANSDIFNVQWQQHKVRRGDSLSVIAQNYQTSSKAIKRLNNLSSNNIRVGKTLLIPIPENTGSSEIASQLALQQPSNPISKTTVSNRSTSPDAIKGIYKVKAGDSFWKIAKKYKVSSRDIAKWNNLSLKTPLKLGQKLDIYSYQFGRKIVHTLKPGESLWLLAKKYGVSNKKIAKWNGIKLNKTLQPGMQFVIYQKASEASHYTVKNGDNLSSIAAKNNVSTKRLAKHNRISRNSLLKPGQVLKIPSSS